MVIFPLVLFHQWVLYCKLNEICFVAWISLQPSLEVPGNTFAKPALAMICKAVWHWMGPLSVKNSSVSRGLRLLEWFVSKFWGLSLTGLSSGRHLQTKEKVIPSTSGSVEFTVLLLSSASTSLCFHCSLLCRSDHLMDVGGLTGPIAACIP